MRRLPLIVALLFTAANLPAQAVDDGLMMPRKTLSTGVMYAHDSWSQYWEGTLKRRNGNIGTVTTQSLSLVAGYGITERLGVMATLQQRLATLQQSVGRIALGELAEVRVVLLGLGVR